MTQTGYEVSLDKERLGKQMEMVRDYMLMTAKWSGDWLTLRELSNELGYPEASISARLRDLRRLGYLVEKRRRGEPKRGLFEYKVSKPQPQEAQPSLFEARA